MAINSPEREWDTETLCPVHTVSYGTIDCTVLLCDCDLDSEQSWKSVTGRQCGRSGLRCIPRNCNVLNLNLAGDLCCMTPFRSLVSCLILLCAPLSNSKIAPKQSSKQENGGLVKTLLQRKYWTPNQTKKKREKNDVLSKNNWKDRKVRR